MLESIQTAIGGVKTALDIAKIFIDAKTTAEVQAKAVELRNVILSIQDSQLAAKADQLAMLEEIDKLKKQIVQFETWETEKQKYELKPVREGALAYARKANAQPPEADHWLCQTCYQDRVKSILQQELRQAGPMQGIGVSSFGSDIYLTGHRSPEHVASKSVTRRRG